MYLIISLIVNFVTGKFGIKAEETKDTFIKEDPVKIIEVKDTLVKKGKGNL